MPCHVPEDTALHQSLQKLGILPTQMDIALIAEEDLQSFIREGNPEITFARTTICCARLSSINLLTHCVPTRIG